MNRKSMCKTIRADVKDTCTDTLSEYIESPIVKITSPFVSKSIQEQLDRYSVESAYLRLDEQFTFSYPTDRPDL